MLVRNKKVTVKRKVFSFFILSLLAGPIYVAAFGPINYNSDWRTASRESMGIAPNPVSLEEAIVQVYSARAFNWRGVFGVHMWISTKTKGATEYETHQVLGWQKYRGLPVVVSKADQPDRSWYGHTPDVVAEFRGAQAEKLIPQILKAVESYPYPDTYRVWPGPNSNTFIAWIARHVPELRLQLPATAIGKDYLTNGDLIADAPSGSGKQVALFGVLGATLAKEEGLEMNILGLSFGVDWNDRALILPGVDRISLP